MLNHIRSPPNNRVQKFTPVLPILSIASITPTTGNQGLNVAFTLNGTEFRPIVEVNLTKIGSSNLSAYDHRVIPMMTSTGT